MNCEIVDKETGDRVNVATGVMAVVGSLAILGLFVARVYQECTKSAQKAPAAQIQVLKSNSVGR